MVVMLVWRILNCKSSNAAIALMSWPGLLRERIFIMASNPKSFTSTSAKQDLFSAVSSRSPVSKSISLIWSFGKGKGGGNNGVCGCWLMAIEESPICRPPPGAAAASPKILRRFCDSKHCRSCSNSLTNSIAPPIIDAWSPYKSAKILTNDGLQVVYLNYARVSEN